MWSQSPEYVLVFSRLALRACAVMVFYREKPLQMLVPLPQALVQMHRPQEGAGRHGARPVSGYPDACSKLDINRNRGSAPITRQILLWSDARPKAPIHTEDGEGSNLSSGHKDEVR